MFRLPLPTCIEAYFSWADSFLSASNFLELLGNSIGYFLLQLFAICMLLFVLDRFAKVLFGMRIRIAPMAVLIVFSPLAFTFYASDTTAHWTKRWVTLFLSTAFQQVVALVAPYVGMNLIANCLTESVESDMNDSSGAAPGAWLNGAESGGAGAGHREPGGAGLFSGFSQLAFMALTGGLGARDRGRLATQDSWAV